MYPVTYTRAPATGLPSGSSTRPAKVDRPSLDVSVGGASALAAGRAGVSLPGGVGPVGNPSATPTATTDAAKPTPTHRKCEPTWTAFASDAAAGRTGSARRKNDTDSAGASPVAGPAAAASSPADKVTPRRTSRLRSRARPASSAYFTEF